MHSHPFFLFVFQFYTVLFICCVAMTDRLLCRVAIPPPDYASVHSFCDQYRMCLSALESSQPDITLQLQLAAQDRIDSYAHAQEAQMVAFAV